MKSLHQLLPIIALLIAPSAFAQNKLMHTMADNVATTEMEYGKALLSSDKNDLFFVKSYDFTVKKGNVSQTIWTAEWKDAKSLNDADLLKGVNDFNNNGVVGVSKDGNRIYLLGTYSKKERMWPGISVSTKTEGKWGQPERIKIPGLNIQSKLFDFFVTPDESAIFITMGKTQFGQSDLYVTQKEADGEWSKPQLIEVLNTDSTHEISPFYSEEYQTLYFSSNRRGGLGGFDVYSSEKGEDWLTWGAPKAMDKPVNSELFDAYYSVYKGEGSFFVSTRGDSLSKLYHIEDVPDAKEETIAESYESIDGQFIYDGLPKEGVEMVLVNEDGEVLMRTLTNEEGLYNFRELPIDHQYRVLYVDEHDNMDPDLANRDEQPKDVEMQSIGGLFTYENAPREGVPILLLDENNKEVGRTLTDEKGLYEFGMLPADQKFRIHYLDESGDLDPTYANLDEHPKPKKETPPPTPPVAETPAPKKEPAKVAAKGDKILAIVNFDFNSVIPDGDNTAKLDTWVLDDKSRKLLVVGYTDHVGNEEINMELSQYRAEQVVAYLVKMGYDKSQISVDWKGEQKPRGDNNTEEGRAKNRRTEVYLVK